MSEKKPLTAAERIAGLLDPASFVETGAYITARSTDFNLSASDTPGDGVLTGYGLIDGRLVYVYSQDVSVLGGAVGEMHAKKIAGLYNLAMKTGAPVIGLLDSAGLRLQEATDSLAAFGRIFQKMTMASGVIPQITAVFGTCGGGAAILSALSDFTLLEENKASLFVNSPNALDGNYAEKLNTAGAAFLKENTALADRVADGDEAVLQDIRSLIDLLPANNGEEAVDLCEDEINRTIPDITARKDDARALAKDIADDNQYYELKESFGADVTAGLMRLNGATVGFLGNQEKELSVNGLSKAESLVKFCDAFSIPVVTLTNVKGFAATVEEEKKLAAAAGSFAGVMAEASCPKVNVIVGDAFGSAYTIWNSRSVGADIVYAWKGARVGMMDPEMAVKIMYSEEIASASDSLAVIEEKKKEYTALQASAESAARRGYVDDIIEPDATRKRVIAALEMLSTKREERPYKKHMSI